jgi:hypothetical protein
MQLGLQIYFSSNHQHYDQTLDLPQLERNCPFHTSIDSPQYFAARFILTKHRDSRLQAFFPNVSSVCFDIAYCCTNIRHPQLFYSTFMIRYSDPATALKKRISAIYNAAFFTC